MAEEGSIDAAAPGLSDAIDDREEDRDEVGDDNGELYTARGYIEQQAYKVAFSAPRGLDATENAGFADDPTLAACCAREMASDRRKYNSKKAMNEFDPRLTGAPSRSDVLGGLQGVGLDAYDAGGCGHDAGCGCAPDRIVPRLGVDSQAELPALLPRPPSGRYDSDDDDLGEDGSGSDLDALIDELEDDDGEMARIHAARLREMIAGAEAEKARVAAEVAAAGRGELAEVNEETLSALLEAGDFVVCYVTAATVRSEQDARATAAICENMANLAREHTATRFVRWRVAVGKPPRLMRAVRLNIVPGLFCVRDRVISGTQAGHALGNFANDMAGDVLLEQWLDQCDMLSVGQPMQRVSRAGGSDSEGEEEAGAWSGQLRPGKAQPPLAVASAPKSRAPSGCCDVSGCSRSFVHRHLAALDADEEE